MDDFFQKVTSMQDPFKKLVSYIPGFSGYMNDRTAAKQTNSCVTLLRAALTSNGSARHNCRRIWLGNGMIKYVDDMEKAAIQMRTFIDKISTAPRGYSGLFDAVKINEKELEAIYQFDAAFFDLAEQVGRAIDNVEASLGDEAALPAAIRNLYLVAAWQSRPSTIAPKL